MEGSRERTLGVICLINFIRVCVLLFFRLSGFSAEHTTAISQTRELVVYVQHNMRAQSVLEPGDEQNHRPDEAHQAPRTGFPAAARNPRPVPHAATNHLRGATRRTRIDETRPPAWQFSAA